MAKTARQLALDAQDARATQARALHRIVRAMHDGHCPNCGHLGQAELFICRGTTEALDCHQCPICAFAITGEEARRALAEFMPYLRESLMVFETWRGRGRGLRPPQPQVAIPGGAHCWIIVHTETGRVVRDQEWPGGPWVFNTIQDAEDKIETLWSAEGHQRFHAQEVDLVPAAQ